MCEMASGKAPFRTAAGAIYAICVSKQLPAFPAHMSADAHEFLSRCLVEDPHFRANCEELQEHSFLRKSLTAEEIRAQTASSGRSHLSKTGQRNSAHSSYLSSSVSRNPVMEENENENERESRERGREHRESDRRHAAKGGQSRSHIRDGGHSGDNADVDVN